MQCFVAPPWCNSETVAKYAEVVQARRNKLALREGEEVTMEPLPYDTVAEIIREHKLLRFRA